MTLELMGGELTGTRTLQWMSPESGLWVATRDGEFLGMIERSDGRYRASDSRGRSRGTYDGLAEAQFAVDREPADADHDRRELFLLRFTIVLTTLTTAGLAYGIFHLVA